MSDSAARGQLLDAWVPGYPRPKGSMRPMIAHGGGSGSQPCPHCRQPVRVYLEQSVKDAMRWARLVEKSIVGPAVPYPAPVEVVLRFYFDRAAGQVAPAPMARQFGDLDKLTRNVLDALTKARVYEDDSQVTLVTASKYWAPAGYVAGVQIQVFEHDH